MNLLLTGASGYIGGTLLNTLLADFPTTLRIYALVRTDAQAAAVVGLGCVPVRAALDDAPALRDLVVDNSITIVIHTADAIRFAPADALMDGLAAVKARTGKRVHFFFTSGAKLFSSHVGFPQDIAVTDTDSAAIYSIQKSPAKKGHPMMLSAVDTCTVVLEKGDRTGVEAFVVIPPMVYGRGTGFGNKISIQFVAIVRIGRDAGSAYKVADDSHDWPMCHLDDLVSLYTTLIILIVENKPTPCNTAGGYYLAENGLFNWNALSRSIAVSLHRHHLVKDPTLVEASWKELEKMGTILGCPKEFVPISIAGECRSFRAGNAGLLGWRPVYGLDHLMGAIEGEVDFVLREDRQSALL